MKVSDNLKRALEQAVSHATEEFHEFVTPEHLVYAFTACDDEVKAAIETCGGDVHQLKTELSVFLSEKIPVIPEDVRSDRSEGPVYSISLQLALQIAANHVASSQKDELNPIHVLIALYRTKESHVVYFLQQQSVSRLSLVRFVSHPQERHHATGPEAAGNETQTKPLEQILINLNDRVKSGKIDPLIGREEELSRAIHILCRRRKNNPVFVGESGVGKTACAEGLAWLIEQNKVPKQMKGMTLFALDLSSLLAGTRYRGDFEERFKKVIEELKATEGAILVIDEIHTIVGAGAVSGGGMDATNILKPYLAAGELRCIGTTTQKEYRRIFEKDHAMARRFQKIDVGEPSDEETQAIVKGLIEHYESFHKVTYQEEAIQVAVALSSKHMKYKCQPDKALDIIDEAGATIKLRKRGKKEVVKKDIEQIIAKIAKIPKITVEKDDQSKLKSLEKELKSKVYGQDSTVNKLVETITLSRAGLSVQTQPIGSFLFAGPTGVGKTELAKQLAHFLGIEFIRFDMSEYMEKHTISRLIGSPPGYVGYEEGGQLTEAVVKSPHSVVLLDEIEKAHPDITNILLQIMDHATLTDNNGRKADFRQVILIMTTNQGARESEQTPIGFGKPEFEDRSANSIKKLLSPEFRNRLTSICFFDRLEEHVIHEIVHKNLTGLKDKLFAKSIELVVKSTAIQYLAKKGYTPELGARPMERLIQTELAQPLSKEMLFGNLKNGGKVTITAKKEALLLKTVPKIKKIGKK